MLEVRYRRIRAVLVCYWICSSVTGTLSKESYPLKGNSFVEETKLSLSSLKNTPFYNSSYSEASSMKINPSGVSTSKSPRANPLYRQSSAFLKISPTKTLKKSSYSAHKRSIKKAQKARQIKMEPSNEIIDSSYPKKYRVKEDSSVRFSARRENGRQASDITNILKGLLSVVGEGLHIATSIVKEGNKKPTTEVVSLKPTKLSFPTKTRPTRPPRPSRINNRGPPRLDGEDFHSVHPTTSEKAPFFDDPQKPFKLHNENNYAVAGIPLPELLIPTAEKSPVIETKKKRRKIKTKIKTNVRPTKINVSHLHEAHNLKSKTVTITKYEPEFNVSITTITPVITSKIISSNPEEPSSSSQVTEKTIPLPPLTFVRSTSTSKRPAAIKTMPSITHSPTFVFPGSKISSSQSRDRIRPFLGENKYDLIYGHRHSLKTRPDIINFTVKANQNFNGNKPQILTEKVGQEEFVLINGKKTYFDIGQGATQINIFPEHVVNKYPYDSLPTQIDHEDENFDQNRYNGYDEEPPIGYNNGHQPLKIGPTQRPNAPPIRIDTCIVGEEITCDRDKHETCKVFLGVSSCFCKPGYGRKDYKKPCDKIVRLLMSMQIDRINQEKIFWRNQYRNPNSQEYRILEGESSYAVDTAIALTSFSSTYIGNKLNSFFAYNGKVTANITLELLRNSYTSSPIVKRDIQKKLIRVIQARNSNIGNGNLYVDGPLNPIPQVADLDECSEPDMNDCHKDSECINTFGTYSCQCRQGFVDRFKNDPDLMGRYCQSCSDDHCSGKGSCYIEDGKKNCNCKANFYGQNCEIDGNVLTVAIGASTAAIVIIMLTLIFLCLLSQKWKKDERKSLASSTIYSTATYDHQANLCNSIYQQPQSTHHQIVTSRRLPPLPPSRDPPMMTSQPNITQDDLNHSNIYAQPHFQHRPHPSQLHFYGGNEVYSVPAQTYFSNQNFETASSTYKPDKRQPHLVRRPFSTESNCDLSVYYGYNTEVDEEEMTSFGGSPQPSHREGFNKKRTPGRSIGSSSKKHNLIDSEFFQ